MFINIHSHQPPQKNDFVITNLYNHFEQVVAGGNYSAGLHPWYLNETTWVEEMKALEQYSNNVLAIGECGLDKICTTGFLLQQQVFAAQIGLANKINKPLIIHCVKAYEEVVQQLQQNNNRVPVIFHGFNKNKILAQQLIHKGFYLSFGKALQQPAMQELIKILPADKIFLETDDAAVNIEMIYLLATQALQLDVNSLSLQIKKNAATVFGDAWFTI
ncbi:TatD family hydrolase [Ferruginibacter sp.]|nr:TatD family hydrolase [Ferruginibacter sp.]